MEQEFVNCYVDDENLSYADALELAKHRDEEEALNFLLSLEIGAAVQARLEKNGRDREALRKYRSPSL